MMFKMHVVQRLLSWRCSPVLNLRSTIPIIKINTSLSDLHLFSKKERIAHYTIERCIFFWASENIFK